MRKLTKKILSAVLSACMITTLFAGTAPVSYTHLDVYKRQPANRCTSTKSSTTDAGPNFFQIIYSFFIQNTLIYKNYVVVYSQQVNNTCF